MDEPLAAPRPAARRSGKRRLLWWAAGLTGGLGLIVWAVWRTCIAMPGESYSGNLPGLDPEQLSLRDELKRDVEHLALKIGVRHVRRYPALVEAAKYVAGQFEAAGYQVERQEFDVGGLLCTNLVTEIRGASRPEEIVVVGAHYDSVITGPGANDNASGTAAVLALARRFAREQPENGKRPARTLRFVAFTNEEQPFFRSLDMGSWTYARRCRRNKENVVAMLSVETIGYYSDAPLSQHYPAPFGALYPSEANFIGVIGDVGSRVLVRQVVDAFRRHAQFPSEGGAIPAKVDGVGWSDHWAFWQEGYPAVMITDTAPFRYPYYHRPDDTPDKLNFDHMARVVSGLQAVVGELVAAPE